MHRAAVEDHPIDAALVQPLIQRTLCVALGEKRRMTHFNAVGEFLRQAFEELPHARQLVRAEGGGQLQPQLADALMHRAQAVVKRLQLGGAVTQGSLVADVRREFEAEAKIVAGHVAPALHDFHSAARRRWCYLPRS